MTTNWAAEHLQVIRTLMERSAVYRRALAPIMLMAGAVGVLAAVVAGICRFQSNAQFICYWMAVGAVSVAGSYLMVRRQAWKAAETFWSPPTRRVTLALSPSVLVGLTLALIMLGPTYRDHRSIYWLPPSWMVLYGIGLNAAGFFMPRGMKLFGWIFIVLGCFTLSALPWLDGVAPMVFANLTMGLFFGGLHLAYGGYLCFSEKRRHVL